MTPDELEALTFSELDEQFIQRAITGLYRAREAAWTHCYREYDETEADNLLPFESRAHFETNLKAAVELSPGVSAESVRSHGAWWSHVEVRSGRVVLTESLVPKPGDPPRKSQFRNSLSIQAQQSLLGDSELAEDEPLYVILVHTRFAWRNRDEKRRYGYLPGSAYLVWPLPDMTNAHSVDLFDRYGDVVQANMPEDWSQEAKVRYIYESRRSAWL